MNLWGETISHVLRAAGKGREGNKIANDILSRCHLIRLCCLTRKQRGTLHQHCHVTRETRGGKGIHQNGKSQHPCASFRTFSNCTIHFHPSQVSWCKVEVTLSSGKGVVAPQPASELAARPAPRLSVASISLKTIINPVSHQHEVVAAGVVHLGEQTGRELGPATKAALYLAHDCKKV